MGCTFKYTEVSCLMENTLPFQTEWCDLLGIEKGGGIKAVFKKDSSSRARNCSSQHMLYVRFSHPVLHPLLKSEKNHLKKENQQPLPLQSNAEMKLSFAAKSCELAPPMLASEPNRQAWFEALQPNVVLQDWGINKLHLTASEILSPEK